MDTRRTEKPWAWNGLAPPRKLSQLMTVIALSGLAMAALVPRGRGKPYNPLWPVPARLGWRSTPGPVSEPSRVPVDRFIVAPREDLDPGMVVAAPEGIDDRMIVPTVPQGLPVWPAPALPPGR